MCGKDMSGACGIQQILNGDMTKLASIACTRVCRGRRKSLPRCCSLGIIHHCLTGGLLSAGRIRLTARCSPVRSERLAMKAQTTATPNQRAAEYLKRVAQLTGAKHVRGDSYLLRAGRRNFLVDPKFVRVISFDGPSTCFSVVGDVDMLSAEIVASALLQLKNNPSLFEKWKQQRGYAFKANGETFKGADWLAIRPNILRR